MLALKNQRHELFAEAIAQGKTATEAMRDAGMAPYRNNGTRLMINDDIKACVTELNERVVQASP